MDLDSELLLKSLPNELAMNTKVWGPPTWFFLHSMAMAYPKIIDNKNKRHILLKKNMNNFLNSLGSVLPCPICGDSYSNYITQKDFLIWDHLDSRKNLTYFIYKIHNKVNEKLGVPSCNIPTFKEVLSFYSKFIAGSPCVATTEKERKQKKMQGCTNNDFKQYKCIINVLDTHKHITEMPIKEGFENKSKKKNFKFDECHLILLIIIIILVIYLYYKNK